MNTRMDATTVSFIGYPKLRNSTSIWVAENEFRFPALASYKILPFQSTNLITRPYAITRDGASLKNVVSRRALHDNDNITYKSTDAKSRTRERLIALFKRIQASISKGETRSWKNKRSSQVSTNDSSAETSVLEYLQPSSGETKVTSSKQKRNEVSTQMRRTTKKGKPKPSPQTPSNFKLTRPPSHFVKKSPIPSLTPPRSNNLELSNREVRSAEVDRELPQIEELKLYELKELAKQRGLRGYSKLKKSELIELLRSHVNA